MTEEQASTPQPNLTALLWSAVGVILSLLILCVILEPIYRTLTGRHGCASKEADCSNNIRQIVLATQIWQQDHDEKFPDAATFWADMRFPPKTIHCITYAQDKNGYAYHAALGGTTLKHLDIDPQLLPVITDSANARHLLYTDDDIAFRHNGKSTVGYADGHIERKSPGQVTIRQGKP